MSRVLVFTVESVLGPLYGGVSERGLCVLTLPPNDLRQFAQALDKRLGESELVSIAPQETQAGRQILTYLSGRPVEMDAPLDLEGLPEFTRRVLLAVRAIPYGRTRTYGQVAAGVGKPQAARAVGQVMNKNRLPLFVP